jgi:hypothetical protein
MGMLVLFAFFPLIAHGSDGAAPPADTVSTANAASAQPGTSTVTKSVPILEMTFQERVRTEEWNNLLDFNYATDDERRQMRYRSRMWFQLTTAPVLFKAGLANEITKKYALKPADVTADRFNSDETIFEFLYAQFPHLFTPGLTLTVGRQSVQRGEGFVLWDGTPGDGSRSQYFNAVVASYERNRNTVDVMGMIEPKRDRYLGIIHDQHKYLSDWDEQAFGAYYRNRQRQDIDLDGYYIYKKEIRDHLAATNALFQPDRQVNTAGARVVKRYADALTVTAEFAGQWGHQHANAATDSPAKAIRAWGGFVYARKSFSTAWNPYVQAGYWALSGNDPNDTRHAGDFDPLFSRWPKWSELYLYALVPEHGVAYWTNNQMVQLEAGFAPTKKLSLRTTFYEENAFHPYPKNAAIFGSGTHRGENYQGKAEYSFSPKAVAYVLYENFNPGSFYAHPGADAYLLQAQVIFTFTDSLKIKKKH